MQTDACCLLLHDTKEQVKLNIQTKHTHIAKSFGGSIHMATETIMQQPLRLHVVDSFHSSHKPEASRKNKSD